MDNYDWKFFFWLKVSKICVDKGKNLSNHFDVIENGKHSIENIIIVLGFKL